VTVEVAHLCVAHNGRPVLRDLNLRVSAGGWLGLIGPNGAGKTTLLRAVAGLVPFSGHARVADSPVAVSGRRRLAQLVAYVPQRPELPATMTVTDYVLLGRTPYISYLGMESSGDLQVVSGVLERLELAPLAERPLGSLSGGEGQRAVLARALAQEAPVLLLDEPTAALDVGHQQQVLELVDELRRERALTVISAMHDLTLAGQFAEQLVLLDGGRMVASGSTRSVLTEATIRRHYGASVRILVDADGGIAVLPTRTGRSVARQVDGSGV
jgi:iron complex transport system ATP-binding protein